MGKYRTQPDLHSFEMDKAYYLYYIANELAEMNRLKRLELKKTLKLPSNKQSDSDDILEQLEDWA